MIRDPEVAELRAMIGMLSSRLATLERSVLSIDRANVFGGAAPGIIERAGELRVGSEGKGSRFNKNGFSIFTGVDSATNQVRQFNILVPDAPAVPGSILNYIFSLYGVQGDADLPFQSTIMRATGLSQAQFSGDPTDAMLQLEARDGDEDRGRSGVFITQLKRGDYRAISFVGLGGLDSNLVLIALDTIGLNDQQEAVEIVLFGDGQALLRTDPGQGLVKYKEQGTLVPVLDVNSANLSITNTAAWTDLYEFWIPGGVLGSNNIVEVFLMCTERNTSATTRTIAFRVNWGGVNYTTPVKSIPNGTNERVAPIRLFIAGDGATNAQKLLLDYVTTNTVFVRDETPAVDSTVDQRVLIQAQWSVADALLQFDRVYANVRWYDNVNSGEKYISRVGVAAERVAVREFVSVIVE